MHILVAVVLTLMEDGGPIESNIDKYYIHMRGEYTNLIQMCLYIQWI